MTRGASVVAIVFVRAGVAATLAYAFWPAPALVVVAALFDAGVGWFLATRAVSAARPPIALVPVEIGGRLAILYALREGWLGDPYLLGDPAWMMGYVGSLLLWFSPIAVGRLAIVPILDAWRVAGLHADERARRGELAIGVTLMIVAGCVARLVRVPPVKIGAFVVATIGAVALTSAAVRTLRRRRFLARVRSGRDSTHRLSAADDAATRLPALDEDADAVLVAAPEQTTFRASPESVARVRATGPRVSIDVGRIVTFAALSLGVTFGFDRACWHGSGWVVLRAEQGDNLLRPRYLRPHRVMEWHSDRHRYGVRYWEVDNERLEPKQAWFARVSSKLDPTNLVTNLPEGTCARPFLVHKQHPTNPMASARSIDERSRIVEPIRKDGRLIYTWRNPEGHLVRADVALDGKSAVCTTDPPPVDDGDASARLTSAERVVAGRSYTCAWIGDSTHCWGRVNGAGQPAQSIPALMGPRFPGVVMGDGHVCTLDDGSCRRGDALSPVFRTRGDGSSGPVSLHYGDNGVLEIMAPEASLATTGHPYIHSVTFARDRGCFLRADRVTCIGSSPPPLDGVIATRVALGSSLACYLDAEQNVWCSTRSAPAQKVHGLPSVRTIDVGDTHACALGEDATVWCWDEVGKTPVPILEDAIAIATGARHTCVVGRDTKVRCWGANDDGQLGDGTFVDRAEPVEVVR